jgi:hypothetical protein
MLREKFESLLLETGLRIALDMRVKIIFILAIASVAQAFAGELTEMKLNDSPRKAGFTRILSDFEEEKLEFIQLSQKIRAHVWLSRTLRAVRAFDPDSIGSWVDRLAHDESIEKHCWAVRLDLCK